MTALVILPLLLAAVLRPLPDAPTPFAPSDVSTRLPVVLSVRRTAKTDRVEYRSGDWTVVANGFDKELDPHGFFGFGRIPIYFQGKRRFLVSIRFPQARAPLSPWYGRWPGDALEVDVASSRCTWRRRGFSYSLIPDGPGRVVVTWQGAADGLTPEVKVLPGDRPGIVRKENRIEIDLGESRLPLRTSYAPVGGIDFDGKYALDVPESPVRNRVFNGSFEEGFAGWGFAWGGVSWNRAAEEGGRRFQEIVPSGLFGDHALRFRRLKKNAGEALQSLPMALTPGKTHVFSLWTRGSADGAVYVNVRAAAKDGSVIWPGGKAPNRWFKTDETWRRHEIPFVPVTGDAIVQIGGFGDALVDGVQVEEGENATATAFAPIITDLRSCDPDNNLEWGCPLDLSLNIQSKATNGTVRVRFLDVYGDCLFDRTVPAVTGTVLLDPDPVQVGKGVFVVRFDITDGWKSWRTYRRFSVLPRVGVNNGLRRFFPAFAWYEQSSRGRDLARLAVSRGMAVTTWTRNRRYTEGATGALRRETGIVNVLHCLSSELAGKYPERFGGGRPGLKDFTNAVPEKTSFIEDEAYAAGRACGEDDCWWALWNEEESAQASLIRDRKDYDTWFAFQHACWRGLKRAFDERGLTLWYAPTHGTCNFNPGWCGREALEGYLAAAAKKGFRYDFVSIHTYEALDDATLGAADRDDNARDLLTLLAKYGYPDTTPIVFSEGFNYLPFQIDEWGAAGWGDDYAEPPPTLAAGHREFLQAASMMRLYLLDLKYRPRLLMSHSWQRTPVMDSAFTPYFWTAVPATLCTLFEKARFVRERRDEGIRMLVFQRERDSVMAVWTTDKDVEAGRRSGPERAVRVSEGSRYYDMFGNERTCDGRLVLTPAPLFIVSETGEFGL